MRPQDIVIGEYYRHEDTPDYAYAKVVKVLRPKQYPNTHTYSIVECEWVVSKGDIPFFVKYFKASDLMKEKGGKKL